MNNNALEFEERADPGLRRARGGSCSDFWRKTVPFWYVFFFFFKGPPPINCPMRWNVVGEAVSVSGVSFGCPAGVGLT